MYLHKTETVIIITCDGQLLSVADVSSPNLIVHPSFNTQDLHICKTETVVIIACNGQLLLLRPGLFFWRNAPERHSGTFLKNLKNCNNRKMFSFYVFISLLLLLLILLLLIHQLQQLLLLPTPLQPTTNNNNIVTKV
jgi:hypothetical protein